jgi:hypothetical protein
VNNFVHNHHTKRIIKITTFSADLTMMIERVASQQRDMIKERIYWCLNLPFTRGIVIKNAISKGKDIIYQIQPFTVFGLCQI